MAKEANKPAQAATAAVSALFSTTLVVDEKQFKRKNNPQLVKASDIPVGGGISAEILDVVDSPVSTIKGKLLWLKAANGSEFTFPCIGDIRAALAPGKSGDDLTKALKAYIGKTIVAKRSSDKASGKKDIIKFDVYTN